MEDLSTREQQQAHRVEVALRSESTAVVTVVGDHDLARGDALREALDGASAQRKHVVVDLSHCTLVDSTGIAALLDAQRRIGSEGGRFALVIPPRGAVARVADLIRLSDLVPVSETLEAALAEAGPGDATGHD